MADELQLEELFISHLEDQELTTAFDRLRPEINTIIAGNAQLELIATGAENDRKFMVENPAGSTSGPLAGTADVGEKDTLRDRRFRKMRDDLKQIIEDAEDPDEEIAPEVAAAAVRLYDIFRGHGLSLWSLPRTKQSGKMHELFADLRKPPSPADIELTGKSHRFGLMVDGQVQFETAQENLADEKMARLASEFSDRRASLRRRFGLLLDNVDELTSLITDPAFVDAVTKMNEIIQDIMVPVRARLTKEKGEETA
ncbi:MAG: hypothetical protein ACI8UO_004753 [Verrucomicrobiales bacterium]|jgi:hypothetical protein